MKDPRLEKLADILINYSVSLQKGEHLLINCTVDEIPLVRELIRKTYDAGGYPHINISNNELKKEFLKNLSQPQAEAMAEWEEIRMNRMDAYISVATSGNPMELSEVPQEKLALYANVVDKKVNKKRREGRVKWCVTIYPSQVYAYSAFMSLEQFEDYYFKVCCLDYTRLGESMDKLRKILEDADHVFIRSPGTEIAFSIKGVPKMASKGERNLPDGEVYTAPVRESVNGYITFNVPSIYQGTRYENIYLAFKNGKVVQAESNYTKRLNAVLDTDEGARYVGEFAFGLNPYLHTPVGLTLFDEKIHGSIHFALGNALDLTDNTNRSSIHWDLVSIHRPEFGGGEVWIDGILIRKDGKFIPPDLKALNGTNY